MKKETATAVFFGIFLGIVVAVVMVFNSRQQESSKFKSLTSANVTPTVIANKSSIQLFELSEPQDDSIYDKNTVKISGKTNKEDLIVIESPIKTLIFKNQSTNVSVDFPLALGENVIRISIYPKDQSLRLQEKELKIYYLDEQ